MKEYVQQKNQNSILELQNIVIQFGGITAVNNLTMNVEKGSIAAIIGPNGAGKTTAFNMISGFYTPHKGNMETRSSNVSCLEILTCTRERERKILIFLSFFLFSFFGHTHGMWKFPR